MFTGTVSKDIKFARKHLMLNVVTSPLDRISGHLKSRFFIKKLNKTCVVSFTIDMNSPIHSFVNIFGINRAKRLLIH